MTVTDFDGLQRVPPRTDAEGRTFPARLMRTFSIIAPLRTHWRRVGCEETGWCKGYDKCMNCMLGWRSVVAADSPQAEYIRQQSGRRFTEFIGAGNLAVFTFEAGQRCFASHEGIEHPVHYGRVERDERFIVRGGDWRGNPTGEVREHTRAEFWQEEFAETQDRVTTLIERG